MSDTETPTTPKKRTRKKVASGAREKKRNAVDARNRQVYDLLAAGEAMNSFFIQKATGFTSREIRAAIKFLKAEGVVTVSGQKRGTLYRIVTV